MKAKELIEKLKLINKDSEICAYDYGVQHLVDLKSADLEGDVFVLKF